MKITKRELRRLLGEAKLEKGYESWDDWQNPGNYAPTEKPVSKAAAEEKVAYSPSGRVQHPSREEMWGFDEEPDYDAMDVGPVPTSALVKRVVPNEYDLEFAEEFGGEENLNPDAMFDYETGEDDVPYGAADYALMQGRGRRTDEGRRLREAKGDKKRGSEASTKTRPDGYHDLPAFMTHGRQSPTKYSGYGAQLGTGVIDDPAVADPEGDNIDADALRIVRQLQARGAGKKEDKKKKLKEATVNVTRRDIRRLVNEALSEMSMMGGPHGMRRPRRSMCLYVTYGSGVYYYVAPPPPSDLDPIEAEDIGVASGTDVTAELVPEGMGMADALALYEWLQAHDEITHVHDIESSGGLVSKAEYMEQVRAVGEEEGLFAPEDEINESMGHRDPDCLYILKRGGQHVYIVARPYIDNAAELAETGRDITDMIMSQGPAARDASVYEFLSSNPDVAVVRVRGAYEMADDYMMELEDSLGASTGPVYEGAFPEELEGMYGEEPPEFDEMGPGDDSFLDYDPEEIPDMDDQYDPDYYEGLDDEEDDYTYGDDPDEFLDLPAGEIQQRLDRGPVPRRGFRESDAPAASKAEKGEAVNEARWAKLAGILKG